MPKLRLMQMLGAAKAGGAETFFIRLMEAFAEHPQVALLPVVKTGSWAAGELTRRGIPHETAAFGAWADRYLTRTTARRLAKIAQDFKPDVIQSWMNRATWFMPQGEWITVARLGGYYDLKYYRGYAEHLIGNTQDLCAYMVREGWPANRVHHLGNFAVEPPENWRAGRAETRQHYGIPESATALLLAGRLHKVKGVDLALKAIAQLPEHVWIIAAGNGPEEASLRQLAKELGVDRRVVFTGWVNDITKLAAATDVWLAPSRWEPLGNTVLDAWAHALPVIASRATGPAALIDDGKTGLLVDVDDVTSLQAAIAKLIDDPVSRVSLASGGRERYLSDHSKTVIVDAYLDYYHGLTQDPET